MLFLKGNGADSRLNNPNKKTQGSMRLSPAHKSDVIILPTKDEMLNMTGAQLAALYHE